MVSLPQKVRQTPSITSTKLLRALENRLADILAFYQKYYQVPPSIDPSMTDIIQKFSTALMTSQLVLSKKLTLSDTALTELDETLFRSFTWMMAHFVEAGYFEIEETDMSRLAMNTRIESGVIEIDKGKGFQLSDSDNFIKLSKNPL